MSKGQTQIAAIGVMAIVSFASTWLGNYILNSPEKSTAVITEVKAQVADLKVDIAVNKTTNDNQDRMIEKLNATLEKVNDKLDKLLIANGIKIPLE